VEGSSENTEVKYSNILMHLDNDIERLNGSKEYKIPGLNFD
jgi:hypothetical protein